jgi:hypothetical protein
MKVDAEGEPAKASSWGQSFLFPAISPLCLVLAAQVGGTFANEQLRQRIYRWSSLALLLSVLLTGHYVISRVVVSGYRNRRDALVSFGAQVRREARAHHWRYEIIESHDGGMLLYLDKTHFIQPERAVAEWNRGNLDALVVRMDEAPSLMRNLRDAALSGLRSYAGKGKRGMDYVLITR